jgi:DNA-binding MarR family transcriptional regulator
MLSKSAMEVLSHIERNGPISPRDISSEAKLPIRTVFYAIHNLVKEKLVTWKPSLIDMRHKMYSINIHRVEQLREIVEPLLAHSLFHIDQRFLEILRLDVVDVEKGEETLVTVKVSSS